MTTKGADTAKSNKATMIARILLNTFMKKIERVELNKKY